MEIKCKRDLKSLWFVLSIEGLLTLLLVLNTYLFIELKETLNLIFLIVFGLLFLSILIYVISVLSIKKIPLIIKDDFLTIYKGNKEIEIEYKDIFFVTSSLANESSYINGGNIKLFLKNGKIINIKRIQFCFKIAEIILLKTGNDDYYYVPENKFKKFFIRIYQYIFAFISHFVLFKHSKELGSLEEIATKYKENNKKKVFIALTNHFRKSDEIVPLLNKLKELNIDYFLYVISIKNPTKDDCLIAKKAYLDNNCDSLLAIGGGSIIDLTKALGILITNKKEIEHYKGLFKVRKNIPFFIAIPTTCGTGSETTMVSVITSNEKKYAIDSNKITPSYTYLGSDFIKDLPPQMVAETAMDALTHALEGYLNVPGFKKYDEIALEAIFMIFENIIPAYNNDEIAKTKLLKASYLAGKVFNSKYVGNVHALSHALSATYDLAHGKTNAIILPFVLETYLFDKKCNKKMLELSIKLKLTSNNKDKEGGKKFVDYIKNLLKELNIPSSIKEIKLEDLEKLSKHAYKEAVPAYPTPVIYSLSEFYAMYINLKEKNNEKRRTK